MPGGRLTQQERQQIALGLADDLAYAEIARRLDRPHLDNHARGDAQRRHNRQPRRPGPCRGRTRVRGDAHHPPHAVGPPRMAAGVLTCLYTSDAGSLTASELVQHLQVSPASVSKAITLLENLGLVRREHDDGRRERHAADNDAWYQSMIAPRGPMPSSPRPLGRGSASSAATPRPPPGSRTWPLPGLRRREHHPRRGAGPRDPLNEVRNDVGRYSRDRHRSR